MKKFIILTIVLFLLNSSAVLAKGNDLLIASGSGDLTKVSQLISDGVDVNYKNEAGFTSLMMTAMNSKSLSISMLLIGSGADIHVKNTMGDTALIYAVTGNNTQLATILLSQGASPDIKGSSGKTAKQIAKDNKNSEILSAMGETANIQESPTANNSVNIPNQNTVAVFVAVPAQGLEDPDTARENIFKNLEQQFSDLGYKVIPLEQTRTVARSYLRENNPYNIPKFAFELKKEDIIKMSSELDAGIGVYISASLTATRFKAGFLSVSAQNTITCDIRIIDTNASKYLIDTNFSATGKSSSSFDKAFLRALNNSLEEINLKKLLNKESVFESVLSD